MRYWGPGTMHFDLESASRGHLRIPVDNADPFQPPTRELPPRQFTQLAVGSFHQEDDASDMHG
eukprot:8155472-Pyramimonas_sp.AAC.1